MLVLDSGSDLKIQISRNIYKFIVLSDEKWIKIEAVTKQLSTVCDWTIGRHNALIRLILFSGII